MKFTISSSSNESIDYKYKESAERLLDYLVTIPRAELNWGSCSISIMGLCYEAFKNAHLPIHGFTTSKYADDIENLPNADHKIFDTTYDLKKAILYNGDVIIMLAGGTGTVSEFFGHLEEIRSNDANKILIVWNEDHSFDSTLKVIEDLVNRKFNNESIYNYFSVARNIEEFESILKEKGVIN
jgi:predicted Rossmann-fold nucleotide-binding protein